MRDTVSLTLLARQQGRPRHKRRVPRLLFSLWLLGTPFYVVHVLSLQSGAASSEDWVQRTTPAIEGGVTEIRKTPAIAFGDRSKTRAHLPRGDETIVPFQASGADEAAGWVEVSRAARVHTAPSISSPIIRFYPVGKELQLIGHEDGWSKVRDSESSERGWIYEQYLEAIPNPSQRTAEAQESQTKPVLGVLASAQPRIKPNVTRLSRGEKKHQ